MTFETSRPPFDSRWLTEFTPGRYEMLAAYGDASRLSHGRLLDSLAALRERQDRGDISAVAALGVRLTLLRAHLTEIARLRDYYGLTSAASEAGKPT